MGVMEMEGVGDGIIGVSEGDGEIVGVGVDDGNGG